MPAPIGPSRLYRSKFAEPEASRVTPKPTSSPTRFYKSKYVPIPVRVAPPIQQEEEDVPIRASDLGISAGLGAAGVVSSGLALFGPDSTPDVTVPAENAPAAHSRFGTGFRDPGAQVRVPGSPGLKTAINEGMDAAREKYSPEFQRDLEERRAEAELAKGAPILDRAGMFVRQSVGSPARFANTVAEGIGNVVPTLVGGGLVSGAGSARAVATGIGTVLGAGAVKENIYQTTYETLRKQGVPDEAARAAAEVAQGYTENPALIAGGAAMGAAAGRYGADEAIISAATGAPLSHAARAPIRAALTGAAKEVLTEAPQEAGETIFGNLGAQTAGAQIDPFEGALEAGVKAGIMAGIPGFVGEGVSSARARRAAPLETGGDITEGDLARATADLPRMRPAAAPEPQGRGTPASDLSSAALERPKPQIDPVMAAVALEAEVSGGNGLKALLDSGVPKWQAEKVMREVKKVVGPKAPPARGVDKAEDRKAAKAQEVARARAEGEDQAAAEDAIASFDQDPLANAPRRRQATPEEVDTYLQDAQRGISTAEDEAQIGAIEDRARSEAQAALEEQAYAPLFEENRNARAAAERALDDFQMGPAADEASRLRAGREEISARGGPAYRLAPLLARAVETNSIKPLVDAGVPGSPSQLRKMLERAKSESPVDGSVPASDLASGGRESVETAVGERDLNGIPGSAELASKGMGSPVSPVRSDEAANERIATERERASEVGNEAGPVAEGVNPILRANEVGAAAEALPGRPGEGRPENRIGFGEVKHSESVLPPSTASTSGRPNVGDMPAPVRPSMASESPTRRPSLGDVQDGTRGTATSPAMASSSRRGASGPSVPRSPDTASVGSSLAEDTRSRSSERSPSVEQAHQADSSSDTLASSQRGKRSSNAEAADAAEVAPEAGSRTDSSSSVSQEHVPLKQTTTREPEAEPTEPNLTVRGRDYRTAPVASEDGRETWEIRGPKGARYTAKRTGDRIFVTNDRRGNRGGELGGEENPFSGVDLEARDGKLVVKAETRRSPIRPPQPATSPEKTATQLVHSVDTEKAFNDVMDRIEREAQAKLDEGERLGQRLEESVRNTRGKGVQGEPAVAPANEPASAESPVAVDRAERAGLAGEPLGGVVEEKRPSLGRNPLVADEAPKAVEAHAESVPPKAPETKHEFSSTQVDLPEPAAEEVRKLTYMVKDEDLAGDGRETEPHATVKFGLHTNETSDVRKVLAGEAPIKVKFGEISTFPPSAGSDGAEVVKIDLDSPDLHRLNKKIAGALDVTDTHPDYKPHVTLAYVKPGEAKKYVGRPHILQGKEITLNSVTFSAKDGREIIIPLTGKPQEAATVPVERPKSRDGIGTVRQIQVFRGKLVRGVKIIRPGVGIKTEETSFRSSQGPNLVETTIYVSNGKDQWLPASIRTSLPNEVDERPEITQESMAAKAEERIKSGKDDGSNENLLAFLGRDDEAAAAAKQRDAAIAERREANANEAKRKAAEKAEKAAKDREEALERLTEKFNSLTNVSGRDVAEAAKLLGIPMKFNVVGQLSRNNPNTWGSEAKEVFRQVRDRLSERFKGKPETPASTEEPGGGFKVGQKLKMMGSDVTVKAARVVDGVEYSILQEDGGPKGFVRVKDLDTGNVVTLKQHPTFAGARNEYLTALKTLKPKAPRTVTIKEAEITPTRGGVVATPTRVETVNGSDIGKSPDLTPEDLDRMDEHDRRWLARLIESGDIPKDLEKRLAWANRQWGGNIPADWLKKYGLAPESRMVPEGAPNEPRNSELGSSGREDSGSASETADSGAAGLRPVVGREPSSSEATRPKRDAVAETEAGGRDGRRGPDGDERPGTQLPDGPGEAGDSGPASSSVEGAVPSRRPAQPRPKTGVRDFVLTDEDDIGTGGKKTKFRGNLEAIKLAKQLEAEKRPATLEEQKVLSRFVGWGGLKEAFNDRDDKWTKEYDELRDVLTPDEYRTAAASVLNAHFTSKEIVKGIFKAAKRFGLAGRAKALESSAGVGNFLGLGGPNIRWTAIERDALTNLILRNLYPEQNVLRPTGFEAAAIDLGKYDFVFGNPPFGNERVTERIAKGIPTASIHNFFLMKSIAALRPGGIMGVVVSNSFLDSYDSVSRAWIADRANFLGAIRLPNNAFLKNAGTEVTTDIVFFQKLPDGVASENRGWVEAVDHNNAEGENMRLNRYFVENPTMMLGDMKLQGTMYRSNTPALIGRPGTDFNAALDAAIEKLPGDIYRDASEATDAADDTDGVIPEKTKVSGIFITPDGKIGQRLPDVEERRRFTSWPAQNATQIERIRGMAAIRDALIDVVGLEKSDATFDEISAARKQLNTAYDRFVKKYGLINEHVNRRAFFADPDLQRIEALESDYEPAVSAAVAKKHGESARAAKAKKADIFSKRLIFPSRPTVKADTPNDALLASLNERGEVDVPFMASILGKTEDQVAAELKGVIYQTPDGDYQSADEYLSGNVKEKLRAAEKALDHGDETMKENVEALTAVIPKDKTASEIRLQPNSPWIPESDMEDFIRHLFGGRAKVVKVPATGRVIADVMDPERAKTERWTATIRVKHGQSGFIPVEEGERGHEFTTSGVSIFESLLSGNPIQVRTPPDDNGATEIVKPATDAVEAKAAEMAQEFQDWIWADSARRDRLEKIYNDTFNATVDRKYSGAHLTMPGASEAISLRPHQKDFIWRALQDPSVLADHVVGSGKTFAAAGAVMEAKRLGIARKVMIVVPNHTLPQWRDDFVKLYPNANVLMATEKDFEKKNRKRLFGKISNGDWDAVVIGHSSIGKIGMPSTDMDRVMSEQLQDMEETLHALAEAKTDKNVIRQIQNTMAKLQDKMERLKLKQRGKDEGVTFDELGVDGIVVDEAHEFKNLFYTTGKRNIAGLGDPNGNGKTFDLFVKMRYLSRRYGDKAFRMFLTGTPISNSLVELFNMQRYMMYDEMKRMGIHTFDAWANVFGNMESVYEVDPSGTRFRLSQRFSKFTNLPALGSLYRRFADVISMDDLKKQAEAQGKKFPVPRIKGGKPEIVVVPRSPLQAWYMGQLLPKDQRGYKSEYPEHSILGRMERFNPKHKDIDNPLKISTDARKAAIDMRMVLPDSKDNPGSKVNVAAGRIFDLWKKWKEDKGTQLVFLDLSTPKSAKGKVAAKAAEAAATAEQETETDPDVAEQESVILGEKETISVDDILADVSAGKFSAYDDLRAKLIAKGIPGKEIAFIHDYDTSAKKRALFKAVNDGDIRVLMGSTSKMGAGTNVQRRAVALHHLDTKFKPSEIEQREGRVIRQGNMLYERDPEGFEIEVLRYATQQTYDTRMWQLVEHKAKGIEDFKKGNPDLLELEEHDSEAVNASEMKAAASGDPRIEREIKLRGQVAKMEAAKRSFRDAEYRRERDVRDGRSRAESLNAAADRADERLKKYPIAPATPFSLKVGDDTETDPAKILPLVDRALTGVPFVYRGTTFDFTKERILRVNAHLQGLKESVLATYYQLGDQISASGLITRLNNFFSTLASAPAEMREDAARSRKAADALEKGERGQFKEEEKLKAMKAEHLALQQELKEAKGSDEEGVDPSIRPEFSRKPSAPLFNRQSDTTEDAWSYYGGEKHDSERTGEAYKTAPQVIGAPAGVRVVDFENDVHKAVVNEMVRSSAALAARVMPAVRMLQSHVPDLKFGGFTPAGNLHGVNVDGRVFVNQLATHQIALETSKEKGITYHEAFADAMVDVLLHEAAHYAEKGHGTEFLAELARIKDGIGPVALKALRRDFMKYASDNKNRAQNARMYEKALPGWREGERRGREAAARIAGGDVRTGSDLVERLHPRPRGDTGDVAGARDERGGSQGSLFAPDGKPAEDLAAPAFVRGTDGRRLEKQPWDKTREQFARDYSIHFDTKPGAVDRIDSMMSGVRKGWVGPDIDLRPQEGLSERAPARGWGTANEADRPGTVAYVFANKDIERPRDRPDKVRAGAVPVASVEMKRGQSVYDALVERERGTDGRVAPGDPRREENFRRWFGDSKVVDENGKPLVVYHGTTREIRGNKFSQRTAEGWGEGTYFSTDPTDTEEFSWGDGGRTVPAYVSLQNPYTDDEDLDIENTKAWAEYSKRPGAMEDPQDAFDEDGRFAGEVIRERGFDGVMVPKSNSMEGIEVVAFKPEQIKSATGNRGTFDPKNPDIRFSRKPEAPVSVAANGFLNYWAKRLRDVFTPVKVAQEAAEKRIGKRWEVRLDRQLTGIPARAENTMRQADRMFVDPLVDHVRKKGLDFEVLGDYSRARYDEAMPGREQALAKAKGKQADYEEIRKRILDIQRVADNLKVRKGLMTADEVADLQDERGEDFVSTTEHPMIAALQDLERTIIAGSRNDTLNELAEFVAEARLAELGTVAEGFKKDAVNFRREGVPMHISFPDAKLREAMEGLSENQLDALTQTVGGLTRWVARVNTQLSPVFPIRNTGRDFGGAVLFASILHGAPKGITRSVAWNVMKNEGAMVRGVMDYLKAPEKKQAPGSMAEKVSQAAQHGAIPGWLRQVSSIGKLRSKLEDSLKGKMGVSEHLKLNAKEARAAMKDRNLDSVQKTARIASLGSDAASRATGFRAYSDVMEWVSNVSEMTTRATYYSALVDSGMNPRAAADEARDLIDFNRKGAWSRKLQALFPFFNPNIQGVARLWDFVKPGADPAVRARAAGVIGSLAAAGFAYGMMAASAGGDGDDDGIPDMDQIPDYQTSRNIIVPAIGNLSPLLLPIPPGFNVPFFAGFIASKLARGSMKPGAAVASIVKQAAEAFTPIDSPFGVFKPLAEIAENKKFGGGPVSPRNYSEHQPDSSLAFKNTRGPYKAAAQGLNRLTGGDETTKGMIDVSPDTLEHLGETLLGGTGRFFTRTMDSLEALSKGQVPKYIPVVSDMTVDVERQRQARFYDQVRQIEEANFQRRGKEKSVLIKELSEAHPGIDFTKGTLPQLRKAMEGAAVSPERRKWFLDEMARIDAQVLRAKPIFDAAERALKNVEKMPAGPEKDEARRAIYLKANRAYQNALRGNS